MSPWPLCSLSLAQLLSNEVGCFGSRAMDLTLARLGRCAVGPSQPRDEIYYSLCCIFFRFCSNWLLFSSLHLLSILLKLARSLPLSSSLPTSTSLHSYPLPGEYQPETQPPLSHSWLLFPASQLQHLARLSLLIQRSCREEYLLLVRCLFTKPSHGVTPFVREKPHLTATIPDTPVC